MTCLKAIQVNDTIFNQILYDFEFKIRVEPDLYQYYRGYYENRDIIYYNGKDELICCEYIVNKYVNIIKNCTVWKQIRVQKVLNMQNDAMESTTGSKAKAYITKVLKTVYTNEEIDERLRLFEAEKDPDLIQQHYNYPAPDGQIIKLTDTFKFDINGAHTDALCEIFPKAKDKLIGMYLKRKKNPVFKQYPNLYVGMLAQKSKEMRKNNIPAKYEKTYNWIVQRTSRMLLNAMDTVGGEPIYVNTDGFIVRYPNKLLTHSKNLGEFKLEFSGDTYVYSDKNYIIYQTGTEKKGSCFKSIRDDIDLSIGQVVHYDTHVVHNSEGKVLYREPINIKKEFIEINEI
jgi:hypothetical protein